MKCKRIIISRTDSIGDVILTLPLAGELKRIAPDCEIFFLGRTYTKPIVELSSHVDRFIDWDKIRELDDSAQADFFRDCKPDFILHVFPVAAIARISKKAKIPVRIGASGRGYHYLYCNKIVPLTRRRSALHETQLNLKLLQPLGGKKDYSLDEIPALFGMSSTDPLDDEFKNLLSPDKFNLILHPKSKGSSREWGLENFSALIRILPLDRFRIFISGTEEEGQMIRSSALGNLPGVTDLTGMFSLRQFIRFIHSADGIVSASTGPLHIAAALGKYAIGLYPPIVPMHPGRWAPVGTHASYIVADKECSKCRRLNNCECLMSIKPEAVKAKLEQVLDERTKGG